MSGVDRDAEAGGTRLSPVEEGAIATQPEETRAHLVGIAAAMHAWDPDAAVEAARGVPAEDRAATLTALEHLARYAPSSFVRPADWKRVDDRRRSARAFWFATAELADDAAALARVLQRIWMGGQLVEMTDVRAVLADRPQEWRRVFGRALEARADASLWRTARILAAEGLIRQPWPLEPLALLHVRWAELPGLRRDDPLVGELLDRLWTTPDAGRTVGTRWEAGPDDSRLNIPPDRSNHTDEDWAGLLDAWGLLNPERRPAALDACLAALAGAAGESVSDLRGWALVHGRLGVSDTEAAARQARYLALAAGAAAPAAALARAVLSRLLASELLEPEALLDAAPDALLRREKGAVREFLGLLDAAVRNGNVNAAVCSEAVGGVLGLMPRGVDLAARRLMGSWMASAPEPAAPKAAVEMWTPPAPGDLPDPGAVEPVTSVDDLVDLLLQVMQGPADPIDVERSVDGMMRLRDPRSNVKAHLAPRFQWTVAGQGRGLTGMVSRWLGGNPKHHRYGSVTRRLRVRDQAQVSPGVQARHEELVWGHTRGPDGEVREHRVSTWVWQWDEVTWVPSHLVGARLEELEPFVVGRPVSSLALPTADHGGLDGAALLRRIQERVESGRPPGPRELATALQRTNPKDRALVAATAAVLPEVALQWLGQLERNPRFRQVVAETCRYVCEGRRQIGPLVLWQPDDQGEEPIDDDPVGWWLNTRTVADAWSEHRAPWYVVVADAELAGWLLHLPWHPDVVAVHLQPEVVSSNEHPDADLTALLGTMAGRRVPLGPQATDLFCWAGTYKNRRTRAAASEAIATAARYGILDGAELGRSVLRLTGPDSGPFLHSSFHREPEPPKLSRIAATLGDAARIDEHGERAVLEAVVASLPALRGMRGGVALLEIGAEIAERRGVRVDLPEPLASFAAGRATSRLAEEAWRLSGAGRTAVPWEAVRHG